MKRSIHKIIGAAMAALPYFVFRNAAIAEYVLSMRPMMEEMDWLVYVLFFACYSFIGIGLALIACDGPLKVRIRKPELICGGVFFLYCAALNITAVIMSSDPLALQRYDFLGLLNSLSQLGNSMCTVLYTVSSFLTAYGLFGGKERE